ncbi:MAG: hypothetical protein RIS47_252, partial [Bacteroidota bacterium]
HLAKLDLKTETIEPVSSFVLDDEYTIYEVCFSPDQTKIYVTAIGKFNSATRTRPYQVIQLCIDENLRLVTPSIIYEKDYTTAIYPQMRLGLDGRVYISYINKNKHIDIISRPNSPGSDCGFTSAAIPLKAFTYLPPVFITSPYASACSSGIAVQPGCAPDPTLFSIENGQGIVSVLWQFGDGQTSTETEPSHCYASEGKFTVNVEIKKTDNTTETLSKEIEIFAKPKKPTIIRVE